jgi:aquaporin Z
MKNTLVGELCAEMVGTAIIILFGTAVVAQVVTTAGTDAPAGGHDAITWAWGIGVTLGIYCAARLSGAHLNPAVTLAFWITGHVHPHDLFGYWTAQLVGGALGTFALRLVWTETAAGIGYGAITPEVGPWSAVLIEAVMVGLLVGAMFVVLSVRALVRWTPVVAGLVVALDTWLGAPFTNTGLNPARTLGPNLVAGQWQDWWVYLVGPIAGAALVAVVWRATPRVILTAKLFHDSAYRSVLRTHLPARRPATRVDVSAADARSPR